MGALTALKGRVIGLDTAPFIYYVEHRHPLCAVVRPVFEAISTGELGGEHKM